MTAFLGILWFIGIIFSILLIFEFIGYNDLTRMFPEGHRPWHFWAQIGSLAFFATLVHFHPWR